MNTVRPRNDTLRYFVIALLATASVISVMWPVTLHRRPSGSLLDALPPTMLWAWERPEDLRFINPQTTGVAFLSKTILLRDDRAEIRPRRQPLLVAPGTKLLAVTRVESAPGAAARTDIASLQALAREIAATAAPANVLGVQIDYDARASEREFYIKLLHAVRRELPPAVPLSITALASWCLGDHWLAGLPVDEAVPMLFQMGPDTTAIRLHLKVGGTFPETLCRSSIGVALDEPVTRLPEHRRTYWWSSRPWVDSAGKLMAEAQR